MVITAAISSEVSGIFIAGGLLVGLGVARNGAFANTDAVKVVIKVDLVELLTFRELCQCAVNFKLAVGIVKFNFLMDVQICDFLLTTLCAF